MLFQFPFITFCCLPNLSSSLWPHCKSSLISVSRHSTLWPPHPNSLAGFLQSPTSANPSTPPVTPNAQILPLPSLLSLSYFMLLKVLTVLHTLRYFALLLLCSILRAKLEPWWCITLSLCACIHIAKGGRKNTQILVWSPLNSLLQTSVEQLLLLSNPILFP